MGKNTKGYGIKKHQDSGDGQSLLLKARPRIIYKMNQVDYDVNLTHLYRSIEQKDWESCLEHLENNPIDAATWVCRNESDGKLRWRLLPIHAAVIFNAPEKVIERLIAAYPDGPKELDDQDMLPLHLAFRHGFSDKVLDRLLQAYPEAIECNDRKGRIPLKLYVHGTATEDDTMLLGPSLPLKDNITSGFERYVSLATANERKKAKVELEVYFAETLKHIREEHELEISRLKEAHIKEIANAEAKRIDTEKMMGASRSAAVALMGKYQAKCKEGQSVKDKISESHEEFERLTVEKNKELERLHGQNVILDNINGELKKKAEKLQETNDTQQSQILDVNEKLKATEEELKSMEKRMVETRKATERILMEYRQKCQSEDNAKKEMTKLREYTEKKVAESSRFLDEKPSMEDSISQLTVQVKRQEESNDLLESKISHLLAKQKDTNMESMLLKAEVETKNRQNKTLEDQLREAKMHLQLLSGQLVKIASEQDELLHTAVRKEKDINHEMEERLKVLSRFADQMKLSQKRAEYEKDETSVSYQKDAIDRWLQEV